MPIFQRLNAATLNRSGVNWIVGADTSVTLTDDSTNDRVKVQVNSRVGSKNTAQGVFAQNFDFNSTVTSTVTQTAGTTLFSTVFLYESELVTNILNQSIVAGAATTLVKVGVYNQAGSTLLGSSATNHAVFNGAAGILTTPLSTPLRITADGWYNIGLIQVGGTPATLRGITQPANNGSIAIAANTLGFGSGNSGQADLQATITPATGLINVWMGVS